MAGSLHQDPRASVGVELEVEESLDLPVGQGRLGLVELVDDAGVEGVAAG